ncbi:class I SAM-dependent methyltransferase [Euzebya sp.]|uniref:class I SAM-dependent methyltransferase n=1 Tax=Euzebya sp. TaxID=1971409 RepID=UPI003517D57C
MAVTGSVDGWDPAAYGDDWAADYDAVTAHLADDAAAAVRFVLARTPPGSRVLELGVGTGRVALPLAAADREVVGVDASARMLDVLTSKPGGDRVRAVRGDIVEPPVAGPFAAVLILFNTLYLLPAQAAQVACLARAGAVLAPDGVVVVDAAVPRPDLLVEGVGGPGAAAGHVALAVSDHDPVAQVMTAAHVVISPDGPRTLRTRLRYAHPAEIDLMAQLAGLTPVERFADFDGAPLDRDAVRHITTYAAVGRPDERSESWS